MDVELTEEMRSDGYRSYIATNEHVVRDCLDGTLVEILLSNGEIIPGRVFSYNTENDVASILTRFLIPSLTWRGKKPQQGWWVGVIGSPLGEPGVFTDGMVSSLKSDIGYFTAPINPGNSGGALVNTQGELVGINTAIISRTGAYNGYGFAIPSNIVQKVIRDLREFGSVQRAFLGADVIEIDARVRKQAGLTSNAGVMVGTLAGYGPARDAGIKEGDVIKEFDGQVIDSKSTFDELLSYHRPGDEVALVYERSGKRQTVQIKLTNTEGGLGAVKSEKFYSAELGAHFETVSKLEKDRLGIAGGVKISQVGQGSLRRMGLRDGLIIIQINRTPVTEIEQCIDLLRHSRGQVTVEGVDQSGRKSYFTYFSY